MKTILFLVFFLAPIWAWPSEQRMVPLRNISERIFRGQQAAKGQFPWHVAILDGMSYDKEYKICGGSIISNQWILTAGHCVYEPRTWTIYLGTNTLTPDADAVTVRTTTRIPHPEYVHATLRNDIALLRLDSPISYSANIQPIPLDSRGIGAGVNVEVSGFGKISNVGKPSNYLKYADMYTISNDECSNNLPDVTDKVLYCRGRDRQSPCKGDSGGALVLGTGSNAVQIGVVSFASGSCETGLPTAFTRVSYYRQWIRSESGV